MWHITWFFIKICVICHINKKIVNIFYQNKGTKKVDRTIKIPLQFHFSKIPFYSSTLDL